MERETGVVIEFLIEIMLFDQTLTIFSLVTIVPSLVMIKHTFSHEWDELRSEYDNHTVLLLSHRFHLGSDVFVD